MPPLLGRGRALITRGRKLVAATARCIDLCCRGGGCAGYVQLIPCDYAISGPCDFDRPVIYACNTTLCTDGTAAFDGRSDQWIVDGGCYRRSPGIVLPGDLPPGANVLLPKRRVQCLGVTTCSDPRCPRPGVYYEAIPCPGVAGRAATLPRVFVCAGVVSGCGVFDFGIVDGEGVRICYMIRALGVVDPNDIPAGSMIINDPIGTGARSCCECLEGCGGTALLPDACSQIAVGAIPRCCCSNADRYQVTAYRFRYDFPRFGDYREGVYISSDIAMPTQIGFLHYRDSSNVDPTGQIIDRAVPTECGFNALARAILEQFPPPGVTWGSPYCQSYTDPNTGYRVVIDSQRCVFRCGYLEFEMRFRQFLDTGVLNVVGVMRMSVRRTPAPDQPCSGECEGEPIIPNPDTPAPGEPPDAPNRPATTADVREFIA